MSGHWISARGHVLAVRHVDELRRQECEPGALDQVREVLYAAGADLTATIEYHAGPVTLQVTVVRIGGFWADLRGRALHLAPIRS